MRRALLGLGVWFRPIRALLGLAVACVACVGPNRGGDYVAAYAAGEAAVEAGRFAEGAARFDEAAQTAKVRRDGEHAHYLAARALASAGDRANAATRLRAIADASPPLEDSAEAANAICEMQVRRRVGLLHRRRPSLPVERHRAARPAPGNRAPRPGGR